MNIIKLNKKILLTMILGIFLIIGTSSAFAFGGGEGKNASGERGSKTGQG
jgi:hypothetical protein